MRNFNKFMIETHRQHRFQLDASLAVGLTVAVCHLFAIPYTGCGVNPARSLGPAVANRLTFGDDHFVYWVGPLAGAALAAFIYEVLLSFGMVKAQRRDSWKGKKSLFSHEYEVTRSAADDDLSMAQK